MDIPKLLEMVKDGELEKELDNAEKTLQKWLEAIKTLKEAVAGFKSGGLSIGNIIGMFAGKKEPKK